MAYFGRAAYSVTLDDAEEIGSDPLDSRPRTAYCIGCQEVMTMRCNATYAHREAPLSGQCTEDATHYDYSGNDAARACPAHVAANPWRRWKPFPAGRPPVVTLLRDDGHDRRYRLEGGDLAQGWEVRPGKVAWCEITILIGSDHVGAFGGEVWPAAWPALFECGKGNAQTGPWTRVTEAGRALLAAARVPCPSCLPPKDAKNHVPGHVFVGWGVGWQPCPACGGSGVKVAA